MHVYRCCSRNKNQSYFNRCRRSVSSEVLSQDEQCGLTSKVLSCEDLADSDSDASWSLRYTACQGSPGQWCNRRRFLAQTLAAVWLFIVAVLLDGLELHQESIPRAAGSQESQGREQRYPVGRVTLAGSFDLPPGIHCFDVGASSLHVPVSFLLTCFGRPRDWESWLILGNLSRPAGSRKQWLAPQRVPAWFGSSHSSRQLALKCSHLKAPVLHSAKSLECFPVAPSKILSVFFLKSFISSDTLCAAQTCWFTYSQYLEFQSSRLQSRLPGRDCITSLTVLGSHPQLITLILYTL